MPGISGLAVYLPPQRVCLAHWCDWNGQPTEKVAAVIGDSFRVCGPEQDVYTLAATAVLRLIENYDIDPARVGMLALGTESASDNSAGAVILRGMLDAELAIRGRTPLARDCEVPELKQACLGWAYALKLALRYVATDGAARHAIVVCADIAEYAPGSSGESTQGAGAVAILVDAEPSVLTIDLAGAASASAYRELDFRKPFARFPEQGLVGARPHDYPVFNGRYSTACYFDSVRIALDTLRQRRSMGWRQVLEGWDAVFLHRPYARMPENAWAMIWLQALAAEDDPALPGLCAESRVDPVALRDELARGPDLAALRAAGRLDQECYPLAGEVLRRWRRSDDYGQRVAALLGPGDEAMRDCGNIYNAALPAWLAAGLAQAALEPRERAGEHWLALGYGSGDAAEALPMQVCPGWRKAVRRIDWDRAVADPINLDRQEYEALQTRGELAAATRDAFVIAGVGERDEPAYADRGIAFYRYAGP